ncbi:MAG: AGE family epimerase/isomerase [Bacteroidota bacterium]
MSRLLRADILERWYPLVIDKECGGYFTNLDANWTVLPDQDKMIVSQARHVWTASKAAAFLPKRSFYEDVALHGFKFLRDVMWDREHGGFFQILGRKGEFTQYSGWRDEKRTYGNAFGIYALAALYEQTKDAEVLGAAQRAFSWIEEHAYDPVHKGYFEFLTREGRPFGKDDPYTSIASDVNEVGYKDQNSSIHLLEAYTELYAVWKDPRLRAQLEAILKLIRDVMVHPRGYLRLFFLPDWTPVSFRDAEPAIREANYGLDHVSFGHDYETAFLMLEASHALGLQNDVRTLTVARSMLDHALQNGWDKELGGFWDASYYFQGEITCRVIHRTKNWWAQAEALNILLLFSHIFPEGPYAEYFHKQWRYVDQFIIDHEKGDWFEGGIDKEPQFKNGMKSHMWKCTYHTGRALMNCIALLAETTPDGVGEKFEARRKSLREFVAHWHAVGKGLRD